MPKKSSAVLDPQEMKNLENLYNSKQFNVLENRIQKLLEKYPENANLQNILGVVLQRLGKFKFSIDAFKKAIYLNPKLYLSYFNLGNVFKLTLSLYEAEKFYKKCINIKPDYIDAYVGLGLILLDLNKIDESISIFKQAIKLEPKNPILHRHLSEIKKYSEKDPHIEEMEKIISDVDSTFDQQVHLSFALGKAYEDIKLYDKAFKYWEQGNILKRKKINYSAKDEENFLGILKDNFTEDLFRKFKEHGNSNKKIIFIVGMPRSGTTLVQQILSTHPDVLGIGESNEFFNTINNYFFKNKNVLNKKLYSYDLVHYKKIGDQYLEKIKYLQHSVSKKFYNNILIKDPLNFRLLGFIKLIFPNAKIVHCARNPLDNCISLFKTFFVGGVDFSHDLIELGKYYKLYLDIMEFWNKILPNSYIDIFYEEIINNKKSEIEKLLNFCNLNWNEKCMESHKYIHDMSTGTNSANIHQPTYKTSMQSWKRYEKQLKPLIEVLKI